MTEWQLCGVCLAEYKQSKSGRRARKCSNAGQAASWGRGHWPAELYHKGAHRLCSRHRALSLRKAGRAYQDRNDVVRAMGFASYAEYLESELWADIRKRTWAAFGSGCYFCQAPSGQVHHGSYDAKTMRGETLRHLYPICGECHRVGEFFINGDKCSPKVATDRMRRLAQQQRAIGFRQREADRKRMPAGA